jgi:uncharacterized Zn-binding protein involved in type VI secretion
MAETPNAARLEDPICHSNVLRGAVAGLAVGFVVGVVVAVLVVGTIASGGLLAVALYAGALSLLLTGAGLGYGIGEFLGEYGGESETGVIEDGSWDTFIGGEHPAAYVMARVKCSRDGGSPRIATGSETVFINSMNAARIEDKTTCGAVITKGCETVGIGGASVALLPVDSDGIPEWLSGAMEKADYAAIILGLIGSLGAKELVKELSLAALDAALFAREYWAKDHYGSTSQEYKNAVWMRRAYELALVGRGGVLAHGEGAALKREAAEAAVRRAELAQRTRDLVAADRAAANAAKAAAAKAPTHILGTNGKPLTMEGKTVWAGNPDAKILRPGDPNYSLSRELPPPPTGGELILPPVR